MSEKSGSSPNRYRNRIIAVTAVVGTVALGGPKALEYANDWLNPETDLVGGVPSQVEAHDSSLNCEMRIKMQCAAYDRDYFLTVEQCPEDVEAARRGERTESFSPEVGTYYEGCVVDTVEVGADTWNEYPDGSTIVFSGSPDEHMRRLG